MDVRVRVAVAKAVVAVGGREDGHEGRGMSLSFRGWPSGAPEVLQHTITSSGARGRRVRQRGHAVERGTRE